MFQDTRPAELNAGGQVDAWSEFRVEHPQERLALLRQLRDQSVPVMIHSPSGAALNTTLWSVDTAQQRLNFAAAGHAAQLAPLVEADEAVAVAYLDNVKLQFDLHGLVLVRGHDSSTLQAHVPGDIHRFQRRNAYRVRPASRHDPVALLRHPSMPEMKLVLRVLDVSIGGCALWLPADTPPLQAGTQIGELTLALDADTRLRAAVTLQHVSSLGSGSQGMRVGCEWQRLGGAEQRVLQCWIDQAQKRRRLLSLA